LATIENRGGVVLASRSGYLQFVGYAQLAKIAKLVDAVIRLDYRPGHFIVAGRPVAKVYPQGAAQQVEKALAKAHVTGPHRTLMQDPVFAIDQLVEIAIRALSPAVNDTFTALTCLDWISSGLSRISGGTSPNECTETTKVASASSAQTGPTQKWSTVHSTRYGKQLAVCRRSSSVCSTHSTPWSTPRQLRLSVKSCYDKVR